MNYMFSIGSRVDLASIIVTLMALRNVNNCFYSTRNRYLSMSTSLVVPRVEVAGQV